MFVNWENFIIFVLLLNDMSKSLLTANDLGEYERVCLQ